MAKQKSTRWQPFGEELKHLRRSAGLTQRSLGAKIKLSHTMIGAIERGTRTPQWEQVEALDIALGTGGALCRLWKDLSKKGHVPDWFQNILLMEQQSRAIREYNPLMVPGLLQTPDYARALIRARNLTATAEEVEALVEARVRRLKDIEGNRPLLWFVTRQAALEEVVGDEMIMREQLRRMIKLAEAGDIRLQIIPRGSTTALCEAFRVCTLSSTQLVGYLEHFKGGETVDDPDTVEELVMTFEALVGEAESPQNSIKLLRKINGDRYGDVDQE